MIHDAFGMGNSHGISTFLIGQDELKDIIMHTDYKNLDVMLSGPIPPNPAELIVSQKTSELFKKLKTMYDYIIIDSAPIGSVSDTLSLAAEADTSLLMVRIGRTIKNLFTLTLNDIQDTELHNISLVLNGIRQSKFRYGYGNKYGYQATDGKDN